MPDLQTELNGLRAAIEDLMSHAENVQTMASNQIADVEAVIKEFSKDAKCRYDKFDYREAQTYNKCADRLEQLVNKWQKE